MLVTSQTLPAGARCERYGAAGDAIDLDALVAIVGAGRGCTLQCAAAPATIWLPLHGRLQLTGPDGTQTLKAGELVVTEAGQRVVARGTGSALWLAVAGGRDAWEQAFSGLVEHPRGEAVLLPGRQRADRLLRRTALRLARAARHLPRDAYDAASAFAALVAELQAEYEPLVARCPGRTLAQRRAVFARLQRVHQYLRANCHHDLDIEELSRMASYSSWHFIRAYNEVYGRTPHVALVAYRLERARELLMRSELAVAEVALASGFENRCAFSRLFKRRFGVTAISLRHAARLAA
jgi:AraC family transcriptional regulator